MKPIHALIASLLAGVATFSAQHYLIPQPLHAAVFAVPRAADWRQEMINRDPGGGVVDHVIAHLNDKLDLTEEQVGKLRPILEREHTRILALLVSGPASLTRDQFVAARDAIRNQTHRQIDALLTPDQRALADELQVPAGGSRPTV